MARVTVSERVWIVGRYNNIELKDSWNVSLVEGLKELSDEVLQEAKDLEINLDRTNLGPENVGGYLGYTVVDANSTGDGFYVDLTIKIEGSTDYLSYDIAATQALLDELSKYVGATSGYGLARYTQDLGEEGDTLVARAYFIKDPEPIKG